MLLSIPNLCTRSVVTNHAFACRFQPPKSRCAEDRVGWGRLGLRLMDHTCHACGAHITPTLTSLARMSHDYPCTAALGPFRNGLLSASPRLAVWNSSEDAVAPCDTESPGRNRLSLEESPWGGAQCMAQWAWLGRVLSLGVVPTSAHHPLPTSMP